MDVTNVSPPSEAVAASRGLAGCNWGIVPVSSGGNGPLGRRGVTRPTGAAIGTGASSGLADGVTIEGNRAEDGADPLTASGATQLTAPPPFVPEQLHVQGPLPLTALEMPAEQRPVLGMVGVVTPLAAPQTPLIGAGGINGAVQLTDMPPFDPRQFQFHGPLPLTSVAVPREHSPSEGWATAATPFAGPQFPFRGCPGGGGAFGRTRDVAQLLAIPPFRPEHVHVHGPSPLTALGTPLSHKLVSGADVITALAAAPHEPSTLACDCAAAAQLTLDPPPAPTQLQSHGPLPSISVGVPAAQRPVVGINF